MNATGKAARKIERNRRIFAEIEECFGLTKAQEHKRWEKILVDRFREEDSNPRAELIETLKPVVEMLNRTPGNRWTGRLVSSMQEGMVPYGRDRVYIETLIIASYPRNEWAIARKILDRATGLESIL